MSDISSLARNHRQWKKTSENPLAYSTSNGRWGLLQGATGWELHLLKQGYPLSRIQVIEDGDPFAESAPIITKYESTREDHSWSEADVGRRIPGTEGPNGGRPIPLQTEKKKRVKHV